MNWLPKQYDHIGGIEPPRTFHWKHPHFWMIILLLFILASVWLTFMRVIDWLNVIVTK